MWSKTVLLLLFFLLLFVSGLPLNQTNSLISLYNETSGSNWLNKWNTSQDPCTWFGVKCDAFTSTVILLSLPRNRLNGSLPDLILPDLYDM